MPRLHNLQFYSSTIRQVIRRSRHSIRKLKMVSSSLFSLVLLMLSTPFSSCAPQESKGRLTERQIWRKTARLYIDESCSQSQKLGIAQLKRDAGYIFDAQKNVSCSSQMVQSTFHTITIQHHTNIGNHKWAPPGVYQPAMNLYLGTDSSNDKGGWFTSSYRSLIQSERFRSRYAPGESLHVHPTGSYQRIRLGLLGAGSVKNYDYWWYCPNGNEAWSKDICSKGPTGTSWSLYWFNGFGPVRHRKTSGVLSFC